MKFSNKYNLPQAFVDLVKDSVYSPKATSISATKMSKSIREIILEKRHFDEIEKDVSDMVNLVLGTATHSLIEKFDKTGYSEIFFQEEIKEGYKLSGKLDLYNPETFEIIDYKTATVWKILYKDFEDWKMQGLIYAWLLKKKQMYVKKIKFHAILKDWSPREYRNALFQNSDYPPSQVYTWEHDITSDDIVFIENYINEKFDEFIKYDKVADDDLPVCADDECWYSGTKYAVMKKGRKKSIKNFDTQEEAEDFLKTVGGDFIEERLGEYRKCQDYCDVAKFCKYYEKRK